ncbi:MAG: thiolase family protein [Gammaproteobacteria bacterium]
MDTSADPVVIVGYARTPIGKFLGNLKDLSAPQLGAAAISGALISSGLSAGKIDRVILGCVLSAGIGQAPARQAALAAGLDPEVPCLTVNKMCGSGLEAILLGHDLIRAGSAEIVVAGGMESMSNAPYLVPREKYRSIGHRTLYDHMILDGLEDPWQHRAMGEYAEDCAEEYGIDRAMQDRFAYQSLRKVLASVDDEPLARAIVPIDIPSKQKTIRIVRDEVSQAPDLEKISGLKPAFREGGTITAASSSGIADGAACVVLARASLALQLKLGIKAKVIAHSVFAGSPARFPVAPVHAIRRLLAGLDLSPSAVDLYEINEAFAVVPLIAMQELAIPESKVNIHGGACAMGHPIGASGARILVTLLSSLEAQGLRFGIASLCIGGGEATALLVQR